MKRWIAHNAALVLVALGLGGLSLGIELHAQRDAHNLRAADRAECHRVNVVRVNQNVNGRAIFALLERAASPLADSIVWTPPTDCVQATGREVSAPTPPPVTFATRLPPPSAFRLGPNE